MRFTYRAAGPIAAALVLTLLCACSRTQRDWRVAQQVDTARSYRVFVAGHPDSELAGVARQRIAQLTEEAAWQQATRANTVAAYQTYLARYPNGSWSQDARIRMQSKSLATWVPPAPASRPAAVSSPTAAPDSSGYAMAAPATPPAALPAISPAPTTASTAITNPRARGFAVQLGAFGSAASARNAWSQLASRFPTELGGLTPQVIPVNLSGRPLYRLEAGVADQDAARRLCRQLAQHSQGCLPVP